MRKCSREEASREARSTAVWVLGTGKPRSALAQPAGGDSGSVWVGARPGGGTDRGNERKRKVKSVVDHFSSLFLCSFERGVFSGYLNLNLDSNLIELRYVYDHFSISK